MANAAAVLGGLLSAVTFFRLFSFAAPPHLRSGTLPGMILWPAFRFAFAAFALWCLNPDGVTAVAAKSWGRVASQLVVVVEAEPPEMRRGCRGVLEVRAASGLREVCNLPEAFLQSLRPGDVLAVTGTATVFGRRSRRSAGRRRRRSRPRRQPPTFTLVHFLFIVG